jgi:pectin methylesterase-like acyl-CoA thioesterase
MASEDQIIELRGLVNEPDDSNGWDDGSLGAIIDAHATMNAAASRVWVLKAGTYAELVDVTESGSSRKLSDLRKNAMEMAAHYTAADPPENGTTTNAPVIQRIRRGFS